MRRSRILKCTTTCLAILALGLAGGAVGAAEAAEAAMEPRDVFSDTWVAVDGLGRAVATHDEVGPPKEDKVVGIFYFAWLGQHSTSGPHNIQKILAANPEDPGWGPVRHFHHWGESEWGYYLSDDEFVIRSHAHDLANAGVDVIFFDVTNSFTYRNVYLAVCKVFMEIRGVGGRTPQIAFLAHSNRNRTVRQLYEQFYSQGLYEDLWFMWDGKPLILAIMDEVDPEHQEFFTFRNSWAWSNTAWFGDGYKAWPWLDHSPQKYGWVQEGVPEQMPVAVAQHPTTNIGRSLQNRVQPPPKEQRPYEGLYFQEQWERLLEVDPQVAFITGWNEWVAQRFLSDGRQRMLGKVLPKGESYFVDAYNREYNRDIEPENTELGDSLFYQMVSNIRRFRGARPQEKATRHTTIEIQGDAAQWDAVQPTYYDNRGDAVHRNHPGWGDAGPYVNTTGRNDFVKAKVAVDEQYVYFLAKCAEDITPHTDPNWMLLFLNIDRDHETGWYGYNYVLNREVIDGETSVLQKTDNGWNWENVGEVAYHVAGKHLSVAIPRGLLPELGYEFEFKWADNIQRDDDIREFNVSGDAAPPRRFNYLFTLDVGAE